MERTPASGEGCNPWELFEWAVRASAHRNFDGRVLGALVVHADTVTLQCFPGRRRLASIAYDVPEEDVTTGQESEISRATRRLAERGLIKVQRNGHRTEDGVYLNLYTLQPDMWSHHTSGCVETGTPTCGNGPTDVRGLSVNPCVEPPVLTPSANSQPGAAPSNPPGASPQTPDSPAAQGSSVPDEIARRREEKHRAEEEQRRAEFNDQFPALLEEYNRRGREAEVAWEAIRTDPRSPLGRPGAVLGDEGYCLVEVEVWTQAREQWRKSEEYRRLLEGNREIRALVDDNLQFAVDSEHWQAFKSREMYG